MYDRALAPARSDAEVGSLLATLGVRPPARVLDVACGWGRHALALARRGFEVVGVDLSAPFLEAAAERARAEGLPVEFRCHDMRALPRGPDFDLVLNLYTAFGYFAEEAEHQRALDVFAGALRPGGRLVLETLNRDSQLAALPASGWNVLPDGALVLERHDFDARRGRLLTERLLLRPGHPPEDRGTDVRLFTADELVRMFERAGLEEVELYEGLPEGAQESDAARPLRPYRTSSPRLCVIGRKPGSAT
jgi:SAM-dependent methyltransferase